MPLTVDPLYLQDEIDAIGGRRFSEGTSADREIQRTLMELLNQARPLLAAKGRLSLRAAPCAVFHLCKPFVGSV